MVDEFTKKYVEQRERLRKQFLNERVGDQELYSEREKLFKPIIESQKETSKDIQEKIVKNQESMSNVLVPLTTELKRRTDHEEVFQNLPFYSSPLELGNVPQSTPKQKDIMIDLDGELLNETHRENLDLMNLALEKIKTKSNEVLINFDMPSQVQRSKNFAGTFNSISAMKSSLGQKTKESNKKRTEVEKEMLRSQQKTLGIYERKIKNLQGSEEFIVKSGEGMKKRRRGRPKKNTDFTPYYTPDKLCEKLSELVASKSAGNTGLDNEINLILDRLLANGNIDKKYYDELYKNIFPNYI